MLLLFQFGDHDGIGAEVLLQHPLGVCIGQDGQVYIADSYNHKVFETSWNKFVISNKWSFLLTTAHFLFLPSCVLWSTLVIAYVKETKEVCFLASLFITGNFYLGFDENLWNRA